MRNRNRKVHYAQAHWSRSHDYRASAAVAGYRTEGRAVILSSAFIVDDSLTQYIKTKNHFDTLAQIVSSEQIDYRQTGHQRQDQTQCLCTRRLHEADGVSERAERLR